MRTLFTQSKGSHFPYGNAFSLNKNKRETPESRHAVLLKKKLMKVKWESQKEDNVVFVSF